MGYYASASALCLSGYEAALLALHARDGGALLRRTERSVPESGGNILIGVWPGKDWRNLLCRRLDAALQRSADHSLGGDSAIASRKYWPARWRHSGAARACVHSRLDGCSHALRHPARLLADALLRSGFAYVKGLH